MHGLFIRLHGVRMFRSFPPCRRVDDASFSSSVIQLLVHLSRESQWRRINCGWVLGAPPHGRDVGRSSLFAWTWLPVSACVLRTSVGSSGAGMHAALRCLRVRRSHDQPEHSLRNIDGSQRGSLRFPIFSNLAAHVPHCRPISITAYC